MAARPSYEMRRGWCRLAALWAASLLMATPLLWTIALSLKANSDLWSSTRTAFSAPYTLENYADIINHPSIGRWLLNSAIVSLAVTVGVLVLASLAGYAFARLRFPGRSLLFAVAVLFGLAVPDQAIIIARHQMLSELSLHNSYSGLVLPGLAAPFGVFLMTQYFRGIPRELEEAARLDAASPLQTFWSIFLPLSLPAQGALGIFTFLATWNEFWWPLISATNSEMYTLTTGFASAQMVFSQATTLGSLMAQAVLASVPALIFFAIFQRYLVRGVSCAVT